MPCGGIYPVEGTWVEALSKSSENPDVVIDCWHCHKTEPRPDHFVEEWDAYIHGTCIDAFLKTDEGRIIIDHGHVVIRRTPGRSDDEELYPET